MKNWKQFNFSYRYIAIVAVLSVALAFTASALVSVSYKKAIVKYLNVFLKEHLTTRLTMDEKIRFRFLKGFPNTTIELNNVLLESGADFSRHDFNAIYPSDTLIYAEHVYLRFNPFKMLKKDYELKKIEISGGIINILFDLRKNHNLKIWSSGAEKQNDFAIALKNIILTDTRIRILAADNRIDLNSSSVRTVFKGGLSSGILSGETKGQFRIHRLSSHQKNLVGRSNLQLDVKLIYGARHFKITGGTIRLNKAEADISGEYIANNKNEIDLLLNMHQFGLAELMSVLPLKPQAGNYSFNGGGKMNFSISGSLSDPSRLSIKSAFELHGGQARNTTTRKELSGVFIKGSATGTRKDNFHLRVDTFKAKLNQGYIGGHLRISDLNRLIFNSDLKADIDLRDLTEFIGISDSVKVSGRLTGSLKSGGSFVNYTGKPFEKFISTIKKGTFHFDKAAITKTGIPYSAERVHGSIEWGNEVRLDSIALKLNESNVILNGVLHNFLPWISGTGVLKPELSVTCDIIDISKQLKSDSKSTRSSKSSLFLPARVYLKTDLNLNKFVAGKFQATGVSASVSAFEDSMLIDRVSFSFPDGSVTGKAIFKTEPGGYSLTCQARPDKININQLFTVFNNFSQNFIVDNNLRGQLGGNIDFYARWDSSFTIIPSSVKALGNITISNGELVQFEPMLKLSKYIDVDELRHIRFKTLKNSIYISDRVVSIPEMNINSTAFNISVSGQHDFDNLFDYRVRVLLSEVLFNKARKKKKELNEFLVEEDSPSNQTTIPLIIAGTPNDFDVKFDRRKAFSLTKNNKIINEKPKPDNFRVEWEEPAGTPASKGSPELPESGVVIEWDE